MILRYVTTPPPHCCQLRSLFHSPLLPLLRTDQVPRRPARNLLPVLRRWPPLHCHSLARVSKESEYRGTQQVQKRKGVWCTSYDHWSENLRSMHVSQTFLQKVYFIFKTMAASLHRLTRTSRSSFPAAFVVPFPEQGVTSHNLIHSAEVCFCTHKRS